jgi:putative component of membrane protein insertase Oxa1/YidC/SpoIIIJ protein YidD
MGGLGLISPFQQLLQHLAIASIELQQRDLSPRKGFACAYRIAYGGESCSQYVKGAIAAEGFPRAITMARDRFRECKQASQMLQNRTCLKGESDQSKSRRKRCPVDGWCVGDLCYEGGCEAAECLSG